MVVLSLISKKYDYIQYVYERSMKEKVPTKKQQKDLSGQKKYLPPPFRLFHHFNNRDFTQLKIAKKD